MANEESTQDRNRIEPRRSRDWTKGSIIRNLLSLSWPIIVSDGLNTIGPTIDMIWVGKLGAAPIAGVGVAGMVSTILQLGIIGINTGLRAIVARFVGSGDIEVANHAARQTLILSAAYSISIAAIFIILAEPMLSLFGVEDDVIAEGTAYMRIALTSTIPVAFHMMAEAIMQASGDSVTPMKISIFIRVLHAALVPFLVLGWWIFPRLGVSGAAIAQVATVTVGMAISLWVVFSGQSRLRLTLSNFRLDFHMIWRIVRIGLPASLLFAQERLGRLILLWFLAPFGTLAVASYTLLERIEVFVRMPPFGLGRGTSVLTGQNLGARQPERAERSTWLAVGISEGIMVIFAVVMLLWPGSVIRIFSTDPEVIEVASVFLRILVVGFLTIGFEVVLMQSLAGAGDTIPLMLITLLRIWVITLPLAYLLSRFTGLEVYGLWWAIVIGMVIGTAAYVVYFQLGRWRRKMI